MIVFWCLYGIIAALWFFDVYSATARANDPQPLADIVVRPIIIAVLAAAWPVTLTFFVLKRRKDLRAAAHD